MRPPCSGPPHTRYSELLIWAVGGDTTVGGSLPLGAQHWWQGDDQGCCSSGEQGARPRSVLPPVSLCFLNVPTCPAFSYSNSTVYNGERKPVRPCFVQVGEEHLNPTSIRLGFLETHTYIVSWPRREHTFLKPVNSWLGSSGSRYGLAVANTMRRAAL